MGGGSKGLGGERGRGREGLEEGVVVAEAEGLGGEVVEGGAAGGGEGGAREGEGLAHHREGARAEPGGSQRRGGQEGLSPTRPPPSHTLRRLSFLRLT